MSKNVDKIAAEIRANNITHGFLQDGRTFGDVCALIHSEITEAFEESRNGRKRGEIYFIATKDFGYADGSLAFKISKGSEIDVDQYLIIRGADEKFVAWMKPEGIPVELIDAMIRILDEIVCFDLQPSAVLEVKMAFNKTRPFMHGKTI